MKYSRGGLLAALALGGVLLASPASAITAYTTAHLNIRTGPSEAYPVVGVMENNTRVEVTGCLANFTWCHVQIASLNGWASGEYLVENADNMIETIGINGSKLGIPIVVAENVVPVGTVVGVAGGTIVETMTPPTNVIAYVTAQQVPPVIVTGEIVVGAVLPAAVPLYAIPESPYQFTVVNGQNVLVDATANKVVYIFR